MSLADAPARTGAARTRPVTAARRLARPIVLAALAALLAGCGEDMSPRPGSEPRGGTVGKGRTADPDAPSVFGEGGLSIGTISSRDTSLFGGGDGDAGRLPVNKYLWQGALDTLSFLPLASSDPFTGVLATEWAGSPDTPGERFKVTAFVTSAALSAASLKVAVYREVADENGEWVPAPVSGETARKLEDAILVRAREIRIAERDGRATG